MKHTPEWLKKGLKKGMGGLGVKNLSRVRYEPRIVSYLLANRNDHNISTVEAFHPAV